MQAFVDVVLPVFGLIFTGLLAGRFGVLGQDSTAALDKFVYWFALPAYFFVGMSRAPVAELFNMGYIATILVSTVLSLP